MDELHRHRSFADSRSHSFYGTVAHVANGKDAGNISLEQERISLERPSLRTLAVAYKIRTGQKETTFVPFDGTRKPVRSRQGPNKYEHRTRRYSLNFIGIGTKHRNLFQVSSPMSLGNAGVCPQLNVGCLLNLINQILRHGAGKRLAAHKNNDALGVSSEVHRRLTRRVRATHDINDFALTGERLCRAATIVNSRALQPVDSRSFKPSPLHSCRDHQRMT